MKNIKKYVIYGLAVLFVVVVVFVIFTYTKNIKMAEGTDSFDFYYINMNTNTLEVEKRAINSVSDRRLMFNTAVEEYFSGPKNANLGLTLPADFKVKDKRYNETTAYIDLDKSYDSMPANLKILSMGSLVYTLTDLEFINNVCVSVDGIPLMDSSNENIAVFNREVVLNNPVINPEKTNWQVVYLYFASQDGKRLECQQRGIEVKQSQSLEYQLVEQLIAGPDNSDGSNMLASIPSDTKINDIKTEEGTCYVNLSRGFMKKRDNITEEVTIYSIVNTLTELDTVNRVQFLIDGEKLNEYSGDIDFSKPFDRKTSIIRQ